MFFLRYHGYSKFFPLWALARYRNLKHVRRSSGSTSACERFSSQLTAGRRGHRHRLRVADRRGSRCAATWPAAEIAHRLAAALERELALGAAAFISFGIAGGLAAAAHCRNLARRQQRRRASGRWTVDAAWAAALSQATPGRREREIWPAQTQSSRARLESAHWDGDRRVRRGHRVARRRGVCRRPRRPVRCISRDRRPRVAELSNGRIARNAPRRNGQSTRGARARSLRAPGQLPLLMRNAIDARTLPCGRCHAAVDSLVPAWVTRISDSFCSTWRENTYCAGRWCASGISLAIAPSVATPRRLTAKRLQRVPHRILYGGRFESAVHHAVGAFFVIAGSVRIPVGLVHQFAKGRAHSLRRADSRGAASRKRCASDCPTACTVLLVAGEKVRGTSPIG